jgi:hypothetical protein
MFVDLSTAHSSMPGFALASTTDDHVQDDVRGEVRDHRVLDTVAPIELAERDPSRRVQDDRANHDPGCKRSKDARSSRKVTRPEREGCDDVRHREDCS